MYLLIPGDKITKGANRTGCKVQKPSDWWEKIKYIPLFESGSSAAYTDPADEQEQECQAGKYDRWQKSMDKVKPKTEPKDYHIDGEYGL